MCIDKNRRAKLRKKAYCNLVSSDLDQCTSLNWPNLHPPVDHPTPLSPNHQRDSYRVSRACAWMARATPMRPWPWPCWTDCGVRGRFPDWLRNECANRIVALHPPPAGHEKEAPTDDPPEADLLPLPTVRLQCVVIGFDCWFLAGGRPWLFLFSSLSFFPSFLSSHHRPRPASSRWPEECAVFWFSSTSSTPPPLASFCECPPDAASDILALILPRFHLADTLSPNE